MWKWLAFYVLRNRITVLIALVLITGAMIYQATQIRLSYEFAKVLPSTDPAYGQYEKFKKLFGPDGSVMVIGLQHPDLFRKEMFNGWMNLSTEIKNIKGVKQVLSLSSLHTIKADEELKQFKMSPILTGNLSNQAEADSIKEVIANLPFYKNLVLNADSNTTLIAITFNKEELDSEKRLQMVAKILSSSAIFEKQFDTKLHYSGMPYIRTAIMKKVSGEMQLFLLLGLAVTAIILGAFFRSWSIVVFSLLVVITGVVWSMGVIELLNYKITILTGLIPPLIMVIGVPNCIFLINKYHSEYVLHQSRSKALTRMFTTTGVSLFLANVTTAIGFGVLVFTHSSFLQQFGVIAAINVMLTYFIALFLVPVILSYLPEPKVKHVSHLEGKRINKLLGLIDHLVHHRRKTIYVVLSLITAVAVYGMMQISLTGYVVDDLPEDDPVYKDLRFFERNFKGVLPFEIVIDTKHDGGVFDDNAKVLYKMNALQKSLNQYPELSRSLSVVDAIKFSYQSYKGGDSRFYILPGATELKKLNEYSSSVTGGSAFNSFIDTSHRYARISVQMADVGSQEIKGLSASIKSRVDSIFSPDKYDVTLTGHSLIFLKGNDYLLGNLIESLLIEIVLIALVGLALFRSVRIILLSKLPCLIPLIITAGIMGFSGIRFKPSTILIFSIAFGIASDGTIYFLAKYRHELKNNKRTIAEAISLTIMDTGLSMVYTAVILFFGFGIFSASEFGGISVLGMLISVTLLVSMITNLLLLPSILISIDKWVTRKEIISEPLLELEEEIE